MHSPNRIINTISLVTFALSALFAAVAVGCGGDSTPPPAKPEVSAAAPTLPPPAKTVEEPPPPAASASAATPPPPPQASQERPPVLMSDEKELRTAVSSSPGAKFELGDDTGRAIFRIREGALSSPHVFTFKVDTKAKTTGVPVGKTYRLMVQIENSSEMPKVETADKPFEFTFPTAGKKGANLAVGEIITDAKGNEKITWTVIAPEKVDESMGTAFFKLPAVGNYTLHITLKAPTAPPAAPPAK